MDAPRLEVVEVGAANAVATITLNQPERRNPLSAAMLHDLGSALAWARAEPGVRVVVLTGAGDRAFCAGADLGSSFDAAAAAVDRHRERGGIAELFKAMRDLGKPIVGRVNGHALAGGFGLACACDLVYAVEAAGFGTPEINVGVWPMMISAVMARNLPRKLILEMMLLGERYTAGRMLEAGLVSGVAPTLADLDLMVAEVAAKLAAKSPAVLRLGRDAFYQSADMHLDEALDFLHSQLTLVALTDDAAEGVRAFLEKRQPEFKGR